MGRNPSNPEKPVVTRRDRLAPILEKRNFVTHHMKTVEYVVAMLKDCQTILPSYTCVEFERDVKYVRTRMDHEGLSFATKTLPAFFDSILNYLETGVSHYPSFKTDGRGCPVFLRQLTSVIYDPCDEGVRAAHIRCLYQVCVAFKKLEGPYKPSVVHNQLVDFVKVDRELKQTFPSVFQQKIIGIARNLIGRVVEGLDPFDPSQAELFLPRPGPGATNTPTRKHERYRPHRVYTKLADFPYAEWYSPISMRPQRNRWDLQVGPHNPFLRGLPQVEDFTSRFTFVPKTFAKARGICIEELEIQWLQQGVRRALYRTIERHRLTKGYVCFTDQSINATLALTSSLTREHATIDMSSASDRVSRGLVEELFAQNENLLKALLLLSTRKIELPRAKGVPSTLACKKYAPMGSALCFPVMGLVHWALIRALMLFFRVPRTDSEVWVYGDDIIVSSKYAHYVYKFLPLFGMKLNKEKSFVKSRFRESCGIHAYNGVDVTPTRFKRLVKFPPNADDLISNLKYEGELYKKGFRETAKVIRQDVQHLKPFGAKFLPKVTEKSPVLGWIRDKGDALASFATRERWTTEPPMKQWSVRVLQPCVVDLPPFLSDVEGYLYYQTRKIRNGNTEDLGGSSSGLQIRRKWVSDSDVSGRHPVLERILEMFGLER